VILKSGLWSFKVIWIWHHSIDRTGVSYWCSMALSSIISEISPYIGRKSHFLYPLHSTLLFGGPRRHIIIRFGWKKLEWCGYPTVKKVCGYRPTNWFRHSTRDRQTDKRTDGRTDTARRHRPLLCIALRDRNLKCKTQQAPEFTQRDWYQFTDVCVAD